MGPNLICKLADNSFEFVHDASKKSLPFFIGRHVGRQALFHVVHNFGHHLFASQFPLIEQDALVFVLLKKLYTHIYWHCISLDK